MLSSDSDAIFDSLFRQHIANIYKLIGLPEPEGLAEPIKKTLAPGRKLVAVSNGTPSTAPSTPSRGSCTCGSRANVRIPV